MPFSNATIKPLPYEHIDSAIRRMNKALQKEQAYHEYRNHQAFMPRSERRRSKSARARARVRKFGRHIE